MCLNLGTVSAQFQSMALPVLWSDQASLPADSVIRQAKEQEVRKLKSRPSDFVSERRL
jgi:hypothetical protein